MGNCLSTCTTRTPGQNGGDLVISCSGGKIFQSPKETPQIEKDSKEYTIVQKELEALQTQISHSQAVLASLKFTFLEATVVRANQDQVHRTTQTLHEAGGLPKSLDDVTSTEKHTEKPVLARSCPAIASTAVQTDCDSRRLYETTDHETECFLPPIGSPLDLQRHKDQLTTAQNGLDLDIYRSCRKLSVLPEEETEEPPQYKLTGNRYPDQQAHSFDSYLLPASSPSVVRQLSDPTHSARRPLQVSTLLHIEVATGVEDSGLGSEVRVSSPSPSTPCWKTPPATPSSDDNSLSWLTPTDSTSPEPEKQLLSVLLDPGGCLAPEQPLVRVPSRRRLVRSLARIGSEAPFDFDLSELPVAGNMNGLKDGKEETTERNQTVFPNLSDNDLRRLGLWVQSSNEESEAAMGEENIESNYTSLVLAFKTDKMTLSRRLELQNKLRDQAEINMTHEVEALRTGVELLSNLCTDAERNDFFEKIRHTIEALYRSALRVSSTAEIYGAVQQENRLSKAIDIILKYVDNLKQLHEKEKTEHEETRKLLKESKTPATTPTEERRSSLSRRGSQLRRATLSKNDSQSDILRTNAPDGESFDKIFEGCETCGSRLKPDGDSNTSHPNSSDESSTEESKVLKRGTSFTEDGNVVRKSTPRHKFRKRSSFTSPLWVMKISKYLQWLRPYEDYALQIRYFIASLFVLAAFFVVAASFFQRVEA